MAAVLLVFATAIETGEKCPISFVTSNEVREKLLVGSPVRGVRLEHGGDGNHRRNLVAAANAQLHERMQRRSADGR
jgi:hypothetical protein